jgi:hypothetical protein
VDEDDGGKKRQCPIADRRDRPQWVDSGAERPLFVPPLSADSVEKLEIPATTNFALM